MSALAIEVREQLAAIFDDSGMSQNQLARETGINQGTISQVLHGQRELQTDSIERIANGLGCRIRIVVEKVEAESAVA